MGLKRYGEALEALQAFTGGTESTVQLILSLQKIEHRVGEQKYPNQTLRAWAEIDMACFQKLGNFSEIPEKKLNREQMLPKNLLLQTLLHESDFLFLLQLQLQP